VEPLDELREGDGAVTVDERPQELVEAFGALEPPQCPELLFRRSAVHGASARARRKDQLAVAQVAQHSANLGVVVSRKARQDLGPGHERPAAHELEHGLPRGAALLGGALLHPLQFALKGAKTHAEHVGAHLATDALAFELLNELGKDLTRDLCERRARPSGRCQLGDQDRRLTDDGLDQDGDGHRRGEGCSYSLFSD
jgi:hypothetical protein